jgi:hypothetical protein
VVGDGSALAKGVLRLISLEDGARLVIDERLSAELLSGATSAALAARLRGEALVKTLWLKLSEGGRVRGP